LFARVDNVVIGDNAIAGRAATAAARHLGWQAYLLTTFLQGEAREVGRALAGLGQGIACGQSDLQAPICLLLGGETTVTLRGPGKGGRNQELALSAAIALNEYAAAGQEADVTLVSLATDGNDGPTDAAGGLVTTETVTKGTALGLDAYKALAANDSYHYLAALQGLVITGPTNTNVNDLALIFVAGTSQPPGT
jgi:hydroxypyruvate reductase